MSPRVKLAPSHRSLAGHPSRRRGLFFCELRRLCACVRVLSKHGFVGSDCLILRGLSFILIWSDPTLLSLSGPQHLWGSGTRLAPPSPWHLPDCQCRVLLKTLMSMEKQSTLSLSVSDSPCSGSLDLRRAPALTFLQDVRQA